MAYDIFVSYSTKDKHFVDALVHRLESEGYRCWYAPRDIAAGMTWPAAISQAIQEIPLMILVFSASSNQSAEISRELTLADSKGRAVIPVRIENVMPSAELEYHLSNRHWLDVYDLKSETAIERVLEGLSHYADKLGGARPAKNPAAPEVEKQKGKRKMPMAAVIALLLLGLGLGGYKAYESYRYSRLAGTLRPANNASVMAYSARSGSDVQIRLVRLEGDPEEPETERYLFVASGIGGEYDSRVLYCTGDTHFNDDQRFYAQLDDKKYMIFAVDRLGRGNVWRPNSNVSYGVLFDAAVSSQDEAGKMLRAHVKREKWVRGG